MPKNRAIGSSSVNKREDIHENPGEGAECRSDRGGLKLVFFASAQYSGSDRVWLLTLVKPEYQESIQVHPTAEAYTFLGWTYSFLQRYEEAIQECKNAIATDPDFGNPYNDIGSYLIKLGKLDEAIPWLEHASVAKRYEPRHFPHMNLGRIYWAKGDLLGALREFGIALEIEPRSRMARRSFAALSAQLN